MLEHGFNIEEQKMPLTAIHETLEEIEEPFRGLYTEREGKFELTGIEGVKTQADVDRVTEALRKEKSDHGKVKDSLKLWDGMEAEDIRKKMDGYDELVVKAESAGSTDEEKLDTLATARVATAVAPLNRELETLRTENGELKGRVVDFETADVRRAITDKVREACMESKVIDTAVEDVLLLAERVFERNDDGTVTAKDGMGVTPGIGPEIWLSEMQPKRTHWWPPAQGGGGTGSGSGTGFSENPFSAEHWNLTKQGVEHKANPDRAGKMAQAAGTTIGGPRPAAAKKAAA